MICTGSGNGSEILTVEVALKNKRETEGERESSLFVGLCILRTHSGFGGFFFFSPTTLAYMQQLLGTVCLDARKTLHVYTMCCHFLTLVPHSSFLAFLRFMFFPGEAPYCQLVLSVLHCGGSLHGALHISQAWSQAGQSPTGDSVAPWSSKQRLRLLRPGHRSVAWENKKWGAAWYWCVHSWRNKYACCFFNRLFSYPGTLFMCSHILLNKLSAECDYTRYKDLLSRDFLFVFLLLFLFLNSL